MENLIAIANVSTGQVEHRQMNKNELAQDELDRQEIAEKMAMRQSETAAKEAARQALLDKLGITADEAKLLLG